MDITRTPRIKIDLTEASVQRLYGLKNNFDVLNQDAEVELVKAELSRRGLDPESNSI